MKSKVRNLLFTALGICLLFALAIGTGCGNNDAAKAKAMEDISGYWIIDGQEEIEKYGLFSTFQFNDDGTMKMIIRIQDAVLEREGTYSVEIEANKTVALINLPAFEETSTSGGPIKSLSAEAIEDGKIVFDGDTLSTDAFGDEEKTAHKVTEEQYQEAVDEAIAAGPKEITVGEQVTTPVATFTIDSFQYVEEILPSDTSGYYTYASDDSGSSYALARVTYTNTASHHAVPGYFTSAKITVGENQYEAAVEVDDGSRFSPIYRVEAKDSTLLYIYCAVPNAAKDSGDVKLTWSIPNETQYVDTYYKSNFPQDKFIISM